MPPFWKENNLFLPKSSVNYLLTFYPLSGKVHSIPEIHYWLDTGGSIPPVSPQKKCFGLETP